MIEMEVAGHPWFGICRLFPSSAAARNAFVALGESDPTGHLDIGVYRHMRVGLDSEPVIISVVGIHPEGVEKAGKLIGGKEIEQHPETWLQLFARRARVMVDLRAQDKPAGRYEFPHDGGEVMTSDGRFEDDDRARRR